MRPSTKRGLHVVLAILVTWGACPCKAQPARSAPPVDRLARAQPQPDARPRDLLAAMDRLGVPANTWAVLSQESSVALAQVAAPAAGDWHGAVAKAECAVRSCGAFELIASLVGPRHDSWSGQRGSWSDFLAVVCGVAPDVAPLLEAGAWVPVAALSVEARTVLGQMRAPHPGAGGQPDAPGSYLQALVGLRCVVATGAGDEIPVGFTPMADRPDPMVAIGPEIDGLTCLVPPQCYQRITQVAQTAGSSSTPLAALRARWKRNDAGNCQLPTAGAVASTPLRSAWDLGSLVSAIDPDVVVDARCDGRVVVVPNGAAVTDLVSALEAAGGLGLRDVAGVPYLTDASGARGAEAVSGTAALAGRLAEVMLRAQWQAGIGSEAPLADIGALVADTGRGKPVPGALRRAFAERSGGRFSPESDGPVVEAGITLALRVGLAERYPANDLTRAMFGAAMESAGMPPGWRAFRIAAGGGGSYGTALPSAWLPSNQSND